MRRILLSFGLLACWVSMQAQCPGLSPATLPFTEGFETYSGTVEPVLNDTIFNCSSTYKWEFSRDTVYGRLSFAADAHGGSQAAVMDVNDDLEVGANLTTLTINLSGYGSATNDIVLSFYYKDNGDEDDAEDRVWLRGSDSDSWIEILDWNNTANGSNWTLARFKIDSILTANSQAFSSTTQIRWGQKDNYTYGSDGFAFDDVSIVEVSCAQPSALLTSNVTSSGLDISWTTGGASAWQVSFDTTGQGSGANIVNVTTAASYSITGLNGGVTYDVYVRDSCGTGDVSFWTGPVTVTLPCAAYTAPYFNNFDNETANSLATCWSNYATGYGYAEVKNSGGPLSAPNQLRLYNSSGTLSGDTAMAVTPQFGDMTAGDKQIKFYAQTSDLASPLIVATVASDTPHAPITGLDTIYFTAEDQFQEILIPLTTANGYNGTDEYIALLHGMGTTYDYIGIDDFTYEQIPACPKPLTLTLAGVSDTSATISFNDRGNTGTYEYQFGPVGFSQATATTYSASSNPFPFDGLYANYDYEIYVRNNCGGSGTSDWSVPMQFTTLCGKYSAPYFNDFESDSLDEVPACWASYESYSYSYVEVEDYGTSYSGDRELLMYNSSATAANDTLMAISPEFEDLTDGDKQIRFYAQTSSTDSELIVGTIADQNGKSSFTPLDTIAFSATDTYTEYIVSLTTANGYNGTDKHIAFMHSLGSSYDYLYIEDVNYETVPPCVPTLITDINVQNVTHDSVFFNWIPGDGAKFKVEIGPAGFTPGSGLFTYSVTDTFSGHGALLPAATYDIYLQDSCNSGLSPVVGPVSFTTKCDVFTAPFSEDFDNWGASNDSISWCWSVATNGLYDWEIDNNGTTSSNTGPATDHSGTGNYLFTEATSGSTGDTARLTTARVDISALTQMEVAFYYHMYGSDMGTLFIEINDGVNTYSGLGAISGEQQTADSDPYLPFVFNAASLTLASDTVTVSICGIKGSDFRSDMAIDEFEIREATTCPTPSQLALSGITSTSTNISWLSGAGISNLNWGPAGFNQGSGAGNMVRGITSPYTINGLWPNTSYDVYVQDSCTLNPNSTWVGPLTFRTPCPSALPGGTYTIGKGPGADFASFDTVATILNGCGISGPVVFNIQPGTYTDKLHLVKVPGVNTTNTITFNGSGSDTLIWNQQGMQAAVLIDSVKKVTLNNMRIENKVGAEAWGVLITNHSDSVTIDSCIVEVDNGTTSSDVSPVLISSSYDNDQGEDAFVDYLTVTNSTLLGGYYGLALEGNGTNNFALGHKIMDNTISDFYSSGIYTDDLSDIVISGNTIETSRSSADGIYLYDVNNFTVSGNIINVTDYGIYVYDGNDGISVAANSILVNNMVSSTDDYGIYLYDVEKVSVYHNTTLGEPGFRMNDQDTVDIRNNVFASIDDYAFESTDSIMPVDVMDYNLFYRADGGKPVYVDYNSYADLSAFQAAYTAFNSNSVEGNPYFYSNTDLHLRGILADNAGDNSLSVSSDVDGDARPGSGASSVDIGADEYTAIDDDLRMMAIISPKDYDCGDSNNVVEVIIKNIGKQNQSGFSVAANITGVVNTTISATYTGTLNSGDVDTVSIPSFNGVAGGTYAIDAYTQLSGDQFNDNDTMSLSVMLRSSNAPVPTAALGAFCAAGGYDTLYFPANGGDSYHWLTANGDTLGSMDSLVVGPLGTTDTTFTLSPSGLESYHVGPLDNNFGTGALYSYTTSGLEFDVMAPVILDSVAIYPDTAGMVTINIEDASDSVIFTTTVSVPVSAIGQKTHVYVGAYLPTGVDYEINGAGSAIGMYRNNTGASFPYTIPGMLNITDGTLGGYYYFFYDWVITATGCPRPDGKITIKAGGAVNAAFTATPGSATATDLTVAFDASSTIGAATYSWDFGDGSPLGSGVATNHTYTANGSYVVTLVAEDSCTTPNRDTIVDTVVIEGISIEENALSRSLELFPNPTSERVTVSFNSNGAQSATIQLLDLSGRQVKVLKADNLNGSFTTEINVSDLADGIYMLNIKAADLNATRRVIKQ